MTQVFDENGVVHPATVLSAGPVTAIQIKNKEKDGYAAVQFGYGEKKEKNINKAQKGHYGDTGMFRYVRECRTDDEGVELARGDKVDVTVFEVGDKITVSATSKGKGFQGVVKRHGFSGGPRTHGQKHSERAPGSIGSQGPQRVFKGKKMSGRMGSDRITVKNLKVLQVNADENILVVSGAIPGIKGGLVEIKGV